MPSQSLKEIVHSDILRFRLPEQWDAEIADDGDAAYWDPNGVGTLRLSLITARRENHDSVSPAVDFLRSYEKLPNAVEQLPSGCAFQEYALQSEEQGDLTETHFFEIAGFAPPHFFRLAVFSYTRWATSRESQPDESELELVRERVRAAEFAQHAANWE